MKKLIGAVMAFLAMLFVGVAQAVPPDFTGLTAGVDFSTLIAAVMAVAVLAVGFVIAKSGAAAIVMFISRMAGR